MLTSSRSNPTTGHSPAAATTDNVRERRLARVALIPCLLGAFYVGQCLWFVATQSFTYDEPVHIIAGIDAWQHRRFVQWNDQPPLARLLVTLPVVLTGEPDRLENLGPSGANFWTVSIRPNPIRLAWHTRPVNIALGVALAIALWTAARRLLGVAAANFALGLFAFSAPLIAHFSLATVDGAAALFFFGAAVGVARWRFNPSWGTTVLLGLWLGGFLVAKFSAPPLVLLAGVLMAMSGPATERSARIGKTALALVLSAFVVWGTYVFHVGPVSFRNSPLSGPYARDNSVFVPIDRPLNATVRLPAPEYISALGGVLQHGVRGQPSFLLGEIKKRGGWRSYYPIVAALKWPPTVWVAAIIAIAGLVTRRIQPSSELAVLMTFPAVFLALATMTNLDIGDRYILPVYSFLVLLSAAAWNVWPARQRALIAVAFIAVQAVDTTRYAPGYLSYFTPFVSSERTPMLLSDSNLDWGQGLIALRDYERTHPDETVWLAYFGGVDPASYGIRAKSFGERDHPTGTVVVSATHLSGQYLDEPQAYHWLLKYPRKAILDRALHVFNAADESSR